jgi:sterol-4alpha-carboxylate 3-dehydrogenase (decarboxylating)
MINATEESLLCFEPKQTEYYTRTKAVAEQLVCATNGKNGLLTATIRAAMLCGEGDKTSTPQMVENAKLGRGKFQIGDGKNLYDFAYIGNTAYAHTLTVKSVL